MAQTTPELYELLAFLRRFSEVILLDHRGARGAGGYSFALLVRWSSSSGCPCCTGRCGARRPGGPAMARRDACTRVRSERDQSVMSARLTEKVGTG
jgi:hypothetical protein